MKNFNDNKIGKSVKPGAALVLDGIPHRITKIIQGIIIIVLFITSINTITSIKT
jgi:hypothetical protein